MRRVLLTAKNGTTDWELFGERLRRLIAERPREKFVLCVKMEMEQARAKDTHGVWLTVSFQLEECMIVDDETIILALMGAVEGAIDENLQQIVWTKDGRHLGDELKVEEFAIFSISGDCEESAPSAQ